VSVCICACWLAFEGCGEPNLMNHLLSLGELQSQAVALLEPAGLIEAVVLLACLLLAWLFVAGLHRHLKHRAVSVLFGRHVADGVLFPGLALLLVVGARGLLPSLGASAVLFKLALPVLLSLLVIRFTLRVLGAALPQSGLLELAGRSVPWLAWTAALLWITGALPIILEELENINLKIGAAHISLRNLIEGSLTAIIVLVLALWLSSVIESRLLRSSSNLDFSLRKIAANATRALLLFVGLLFALSAAGIDLTAIGVLGGAIGVGIGFGMQKLAANYVSGFVILAERSLRIGDIVKVDGFEGRISDIKMRYTVIQALDGREAIVPNEILIGQRVENSSLADPKMRLQTTLQVAYATDLDALLPQLVEAINEVPRVLADPAPMVHLSKFAADGLELSLYFWIGDPENGQNNVHSDVNLALLRRLNQLGVEIPFPQRVLHGAALAP
jgi:small-conductance mechanosensitive channel